MRHLSWTVGCLFPGSQAPHASRTMPGFECEKSAVMGAMMHCLHPPSEPDVCVTLTSKTVAWWWFKRTSHTVFKRHTSRTLQSLLGAVCFQWLLNAEAPKLQFRPSGKGLSCDFPAGLDEDIPASVSQICFLSVPSRYDSWEDHHITQHYQSSAYSQNILCPTREMLSSS